MALTAFNPMFLTVTTAVSNDGLLIALTTAALCVLMRALAQGVTVRHTFAFGALAGLASLTKLSGALLLPLAGAMLIAPGCEPHATTPRLRRSKLIAAVIIPWLLIAGWWYARNVVLYAVISPFRYIIPAYTPPLVADLPEDMTPAQQRLGAFAEVVGYQMRPEDVRPGDKVRVNVVMRALRATSSNYLLVVNLLGRDNRPLARFDTFTGGGLLPSSQWRAGQMWRDAVDLTIPEDAEAPATLRVQFALYNRGSGDVIPGNDERGNPSPPLFDGATLLPRAQSSEADGDAWIAALDDVGSLQSARFAPVATAGRPLTVTLTWRTLRPTLDAHTTFVHLVDERGALRAQGDAPPLGGQFPTTRWRAGVTFDDPYTLPLPADLPPGRYRLFAGLYHATDLTRLPAFDRSGKRLQDDRIYLGEVRIVPST